MEYSVAVEDRDNNNNECKCTDTPIDLYTIKVLKDNALIDDERFFKLKDMYVKDDRIKKVMNIAMSTKTMK